MSSSKEKISHYIKGTAKELGFTACGISKAEHLGDESPHFKAWLEQGYHAGMSYMNRNVEKRLNPVLLNEWARSVIVVLYNYFPGNGHPENGNYKISKYAYGKDYHNVIKDKLRKVVDAIEDEIGEITARVFVDSAPVLERAWAKRSGLGWVGKNACLINKQMGSFFFIATIITDLDLEYDEAETNTFCGNCTKCMDACPNGAIISPGTVDSSKCISYLSIEHKGEFDMQEGVGLHSWIFGCDICQDVCPWNKFARAHAEPSFLPSKKLMSMTDADWNKLDEETFNELFRGTAVERTGYAAIKRNIEQGKNKE